MASERPLPVVLCWHMHQPCYADPVDGSYQLPWVYLHAIKDYVDMAAHLEQSPGARAVVNFAPTLLEQIEDYAEQVRAYLADGQPLRDPLLATLGPGVFPVNVEERAALIAALTRANRSRVIERFAPFRRLVDLAAPLREQPQEALYLSDQFLTDLAVWYHLGWIGETVRRADVRLRVLEDRASNFRREDCRLLLEVIGELLGGVLPRYRALAESGQVELSVTPYAHPILPLLLDLGAARESLPDAPLPAEAGYPGGEERARWHIERGLAVFERCFGRRPVGCWPAEGGVSDAGCALLGEAGFRWCATGEGVLRNSLRRAGEKADDGAKPWLHRAYRLEPGGPSCFFRDDGLSDLVGFTYSDWHADDAAANLVHHLEQIEKATRHVADRVVSIILDGENAWEYYPSNGAHFLGALYRSLAENPGIDLTTFERQLAAAPPRRALPSLVAGSWVYGTFSTWIGEPDKNRGWSMLVEAKRAFDQAVAEGLLAGERLERAQAQLAICEGSDWFWWFGDYNPAASVADFERLYRRQLRALYAVIGRAAPEYLDRPFTRGSGQPPHGGVMRTGQPTAD